MRKNVPFRDSVRDWDKSTCKTSDCAPRNGATRGSFQNPTAYRTRPGGLFAETLEQRSSRADDAQAPPGGSVGFDFPRSSIGRKSENDEAARFGVLSVKTCPSTKHCVAPIPIGIRSIRKRT